MINTGFTSNTLSISCKRVQRSIATKKMSTPATLSSIIVSIILCLLIKSFLSSMLKFSGKRLFKKRDYQALQLNYGNYLPDYNTLFWLSFISMLIDTLIVDNSKKFTFAFDDGVLSISSDSSLLLEQQYIDKIDKPNHLVIQL